MSNLTWIDVTIVIVAIVALRVVSLSTKSHMRGVADFLAANRAAGRYLLTTATAMGGTGVVTFVGLFEVYATRGFPPLWWQFLTVPVSAIALLTGWVFYRFRETRALTLAQFFEMRYSRRFRIFAGILCWTSGILNFGIFPGVAARFIVYFCGLQPYFYIPHIPFAIPTFAVIMAADLGLALLFVTQGGQITVMVTECMQGIVSSIAMIVIILFILHQVHWSSIVTALNTAPAHASMLNPYDTGKVDDFNVWFYLIGVFGGIYGWMSWQGTQGLYCSARTPHEQKMGGIIGVWRQVPQSLLSLLLPLAAFTILRLPEYSGAAATVGHTLKTITNESVRGQMQVPIAMAHFLPTGMKGLLLTIMVYFSFTCHDTYMHSWGSIFVQDILMPLRKKPFTPDQHISYLRWSIIGVGVFGFLFSYLYPPSQQILMFFATTGTIWLGGSGACIIGGLYWKKGTTAGAYAALIVGAVMGVTELVFQVVYGKLPLNGQWLWFISILGAVTMYVVLSLATGRKDFNLERMLHRGKYSDTSEQLSEAPKESRWLQLAGITREFSLGDRILAIALVVWNLGWLLLFAVASIWNMFTPLGTKWWASMWHFYLVLQVIISVPATAWFAVGGIIDIRLLFKKLDNTVRDHTDDGRVVHEPETPAADQNESIGVNTESVSE